MSEKEMATISKYIDDFSRSLYLNLSKSYPKENLIVSPLSVQIVLAMVLQGAKEHTEKEIIEGLKFEAENRTVIQEGFKTLLENLKGNGNLTLNIANKMYTEKTMSIKPEFAKILTEHFKSEVGLVDFISNYEKSRVEINDWVADKTNQLIKDLLAKGILDSLTRTVLVNAIYFKGKWKYPFKADDNTKGDFHIDENTVAEVDYMNIKKYLRYAELPDLEARAVELEYAGGEYSLLILLPDQITGLNALQEKLHSKPIADIRSNLRSSEVILKLPKFRIESTLDLNNALQQLGMTSMFTTNANFSGITDEDELVVTKVIQKAFIDVNEEGTEAAAATGMVLMKRCLPRREEFFINRPFIYFLNNKSSVPIFMGHIINPSILI